jgi:transcriptional regulator with XRE-family HTH domain
MEQMTMFDTLDGSMSNQPRLISPAEMAIVCQMQRAARGWSQDTLAELTGLTVRTVQRVESGQPSNPETRRALARVFGADDIDTFNKPHAHLTPEEFEAQERKRKEEFEREYVTVDVTPMTGRGIARLGEGVHAACVELSDALAARKDVEDVLAELKDYVRDFMDIADDVGAGDRLTMGDEMERMVGDLRRLGCSIVGGKRSLSLPWGRNGKPMTTTAVYLFIVPAGKEPAAIAVPRDAGTSL